MIDAPFNSLYVVQIFKVFHNLKIAPSVSVYFCHGCCFSSVMFIHSPPTSIIVVFVYHPHSLQLHAETEKAGKCHFSLLTR